ncbi:MAG: CHASE2 domain-containing protein, partial [Bacteroidetes bacterium]
MMTFVGSSFTKGSDSVPGGTSRSRLKQLLLGCSLALLVIILTQDVLFEFTPLNRLELSTIDFRFRQRGPLAMPPESLDVVIVEISNESFKTLPEKYPFPRSYYARLVRNLTRAGAVAIGFDIIMEEPDEHGSVHDDDFRRAIWESNIVALGGKTEIGN